MSDREPIKSIITPIRLEYDYTAGLASSRFLRGLAKGKIIGARVGDDGPVYVPPRGADPKQGLATDQEVEVADKGTLTTFCIVRVPSQNLSFNPPYACVSVLLDGADIPMMHVMQETPLEDIRMGMRVQAVWVEPDELETSVASIKYFKPIDEPDADFDAYKEHPLMRDVAILSFAQSCRAREAERNEVEILMPVVHEAVDASGLARGDIGFTCSGSSDYLAGQPFAFVSALDAAGAWPPIKESHVEMDGAWAMYEAWIKIQTGEVDSALVYSFGKSSPGDLPTVLALQLDPYCVTPLWPDADSLAAIQARAFLEATGKSERDLAQVVSRSLRDARDNPHAVRSGEFDVEKLLAEPMLRSPLRANDCGPAADGAVAVVMAEAGVARKLAGPKVWIRGFDHRIEPQGLGLRDLTRSASTEIAAQKARVHERPVDLAELYAPYSHQELILRAALGLGDEVRINPSGGALAAHPVMAAGLTRVGEAARRIKAGEGRRAVAHATAGPCLQQNLVCVLEGE